MISRTLGQACSDVLPAQESSTVDVLKEWFYYFFQCTECRRCSVFCPYGIDTAEVTMIGTGVLNLVGLNINWVIGAGSKLLS